MKHFLLFFTYLLIFSTVNYSQIISTYGLKIGVTASNTNFEYDPSLNITSMPYNRTRFSPNIGIFLRLFDLKMIDFETQLTYLQKGGDNEFEIRTINQPDGTGEFLTFDIQFDYLQFQLGLRPKYLINKIEIYSYVGGSFDYLLDVKGFSSPEDRFEKIILGYAIGLGLSFRELLNQPFFIEIIYNSDLSDIYPGESSKIKNNSWLFRIGVSLGKK